MSEYKNDNDTLVPNSIFAVIGMLGTFGILAIGIIVMCNL